MEFNSIDLDSFEWSEIYLEDGTSYFGDWKNNAAHGQGKLTYSNGDYFEGTWNEGKFIRGKKRDTFINGDIYEGEWKKIIFAWNTINVKNMSAMFLDTESFRGNISNWNTSNVIDMSYMFSDTSLFNCDIITNDIRDKNNKTLYIAWDVSKVENMEQMFKGAKSFTGNISNWDTSNVKYMEGIFSDAILFNCNINTKLLDNGKIAWDTSNIINMNKMFNNAFSFKGNISNWNVDNLLTMFDMFKNIDFDYNTINTKSCFLNGKFSHIAWKIYPDLIMHNIDINENELNWNNNIDETSHNLYYI